MIDECIALSVGVVLTCPTRGKGQIVAYHQDEDLDHVWDIQWESGDFGTYWDDKVKKDFSYCAHLALPIRNAKIIRVDFKRRQRVA